MQGWWKTEKEETVETGGVSTVSPFFVVLSCVFVVWCRRFLTLPQPPGCSTISVCRLSFRVRNGTGRFPAAIDHRQTFRTIPSSWVFGCCVRYCIVDAVTTVTNCFLLLLFLPAHIVCVGVCCGQLVPVAFTPYSASRSGLSTLSSLGDLNETSS